MKRIVLLISAILLTGTVLAQRLTEQQAKERAASFLKSRPGATLAKGAGVKAEGLTTVSLGIDGVYVFNVDGGGYVVAGGDARVLPVLGYGNNGSLAADRIPENMKAWLEGYARQAAFAAEHNLDCSVRTETDDHQPIEPLLKTNWGQDKPFNLLCPPVDENDPSKGNCPTGCVATAMAQVANYHKWPLKADGTGAASDHYAKSYNIDMSNDTFDWDNILDTYTNEKGEVTGNETQWNAVSLLMRDMAYSVSMKYAPNGSGALSMFIPKAMVNNFGYDKGTHLEYRDWYTAEQWDNLIYDNLSNYGPILYSGATSKKEGHEFVCDGYRGDGYYHFNWGWDGMSNGYFLLSSLNPEVHGTGGSVESLAFDYNQDVTLGLCKPKEGSQTVVNVYQQNDLSYSYSDKAFNGPFQVLVAQEETVDLGYWIKNLATNEESYYTEEQVDIAYSDGLRSMTFKTKLPDGKYKVRPVFKKAADSEWQFFKTNVNYIDCLLLDVVDGKKTFYTDAPFEYRSISLSNFHIFSNGAFTGQLMIKTNGAEYATTFYTKVFDEVSGEIVMDEELGNCSFTMANAQENTFYVPIKVGEVDKSHTFKVQIYDGDKLIAEKTGIKAYDMAYLEEIEPLTIEEVVDGKLYRDAETLHFKFKYKVVGPDFVNLVTLRILSSGELEDFYYTFDNKKELTVEGNEYSLNLGIEASQLENEFWKDNVEFRLLFRYDLDEKNSLRLKDGSEIVLRAKIVDDDPTGVEGIEAADSSADEKRYDLQGRPVTKSSKRRIYVVKGKKVLNNQK